MSSRRAAMSLLSKLGCAGVGIGVASSILSSSMYIVRTGERAVVVDRFQGVVDEAVGEGAHLLIPWVQKPFIYDIRMRTHTLSFATHTKDFENVNLTLRLLSRPDASRLPHMFKTIGIQYDEKVLLSSVETEIQDVVAQFNAAQLLTDWVPFMDLLRERLGKRMRAEDLNIVLDDLSVARLYFLDRATQTSLIVAKE